MRHHCTTARLHDCIAFCILLATPRRPGRLPETALATTVGTPVCGSRWSRSCLCPHSSQSPRRPQMRCRHHHSACPRCTYAMPAARHARIPHLSGFLLSFPPVLTRQPYGGLCATDAANALLAQRGRPMDHPQPAAPHPLQGKKPAKRAIDVHRGVGTWLHDLNHRASCSASELPALLLCFTPWPSRHTRLVAGSRKIPSTASQVGPTSCRAQVTEVTMT